MRWLHHLMLIIMPLALISCKKTKIQGHSHIVTVKRRPIVSHLYYNGIIEPIATQAVISPVTGRVANLYFVYGQALKQAQKLITIDSQMLSEHFHTAMSDYLMQKNQLARQKINYASSKALYRAGILDRNTYQNDKGTYETTAMNFYQKKLALEKILHQVHMPAHSLEKLTIEQTKQINQVLSERFKNIPVYAHKMGIALFPIPSDNKNHANDLNGQKLIVGSQIKQGQLILSIGDQSGYRVRFKVSETDINRLKKGMSVSVTGPAFPQITLHGVIAQMTSQANTQNGSDPALAQFEVVVDIPHISTKTQKVIHIGMNAIVDIRIKSAPQLMIPIQAITLKNGQNWVNLLKPSGQTIPVKVNTAQTTLEQVAIIQGLKAGQKVIVHD